MIFEVCIDSVEGAKAARLGGAHRVELCASLVEGGITPSLGMIQTVRAAVDLDVNVILRPRAGDFLYTEMEFDVMCKDLEAIKASGVNGVVLGLLLPDGTIDTMRTRQLIDLARPLSVTFHRAFDLCRDPQTALDDLITLGVDRLLTSGQQANALLGANLIADLVQKAQGRTIIMPGGGINSQTLPRLAAITRAQEFHFGGRTTVPSRMQFRRPGLWMGKPYQPDEYTLQVTAASLVREVIASFAQIEGNETNSR